MNIILEEDLKSVQRISLNCEKLELESNNNEVKTEYINTKVENFTMEDEIICLMRTLYKPKFRSIV